MKPLEGEHRGGPGGTQTLTQQEDCLEDKFREYHHKKPWIYQIPVSFAREAQRNDQKKSELRCCGNTHIRKE